MNVSHSLFIVAFTALSATALAEPITPRPIGLLDSKGLANTEQSDFFAIRGAIAPKSPAFSSTKLVFSAQIKTSAKGDTRGLFVQDLLSGSSYLIDKNAPLKSIGSFLLPPGGQLDTFLRTNAVGDSKKNHFPSMFFHAPGLGLYGTEGGKAAFKVRAESAKDATTAVVGTAIRLNEYRFDEVDATTQARIFFATKDAKGGIEPFISAGTGGTTKLLADLVTGKDATTKKPLGSDPLQFAALGPQNETQRLFFVAKSTADNGTYQLWVVAPPTVAKGKPTYTPTMFTTGATALAGTPRNLVANGSDLFFTAPTIAGGTPVLWHLSASSSTLETFSETADPQQLTFINEDSSYSDLAFSSLDGGNVRRYARWSHTNNSVSVLGAAQGLNTPMLITPADNYFYFADTYQTLPDNYLEKHSLADNSITDIKINDGFNAPYYAQDITEICLVSNTLYFVAFNVLCRIDNDSGGSFNSVAEVVYTASGLPVVGAHNLGAVVDAGSPGFFRLYFSAPVSTTQNAEFVPAGSKITDFGTKPWVTEAP